MPSMFWPYEDELHTASALSQSGLQETTTMLMSSMVCRVFVFRCMELINSGQPELAADYTNINVSHRVLSTH